jgi:hypothetical protein
MWPPTQKKNNFSVAIWQNFKLKKKICNKSKFPFQTTVSPFEDFLTVKRNEEKTDYSMVTSIQNSFQQMEYSWIFHYYPS